MSSNLKQNIVLHPGQKKKKKASKRQILLILFSSVAFATALLLLFDAGFRPRPGWFPKDFKADFT